MAELLSRYLRYTSGQSDIDDPDMNPQCYYSTMSSIPSDLLYISQVGQPPAYST